MDEFSPAKVNSRMRAIPTGVKKNDITSRQWLAVNRIAHRHLPLDSPGKRNIKSGGIDFCNQGRAVNAAAAIPAVTVRNTLPFLGVAPQLFLNSGNRPEAI